MARKRLLRKISTCECSGKIPTLAQAGIFFELWTMLGASGLYRLHAHACTVVVELEEEDDAEEERECVGERGEDVRMRMWERTTFLPLAISTIGTIPDMGGGVVRMTHLHEGWHSFSSSPASPMHCLHSLAPASTNLPVEVRNQPLETLPLGGGFSVTFGGGFCGSVLLYSLTTCTRWKPKDGVGFN